MANKWVVRTKMTTMKASEEVAHLVPTPGVLRAAPAFCGSRVGTEEFWEKAAKKMPVCKTCKAHHQRKR